MAAREMKRAVLIFLAAAASGCGDNLGLAPLDAAGPTPDASLAADAADALPAADAAPGDGMTDAAPDDARPPSNIDRARVSNDGPVDIQINQVFVTYLKPDVVSEPAGFFIQADPLGPALFIEGAPPSLDPPLAVGDMVSFRILEMGTDDYQRRALQVTDLDRHAHDALPDTLVQDVSAIPDLVNAVEGYESELIAARATISTEFQSLDGFHSRARAETSAITGDARLIFGLPNTLQEDINLVPECVIEIARTPLWRFRSEAHLHIWKLKDIVTAECPATVEIEAIAVDPTHVRVTFDRRIAAGSVNDAANQFLFEGGLVTLSADVPPEGKTVLLTTSTQEAGRRYELNVAATVKDVFERGIGARTADFLGFAPPPKILINEIKANVPDGCDLLELRVLTGGSMDGVSILHRTEPMLTFRDFTVASGDLIVVHSAPTVSSCNPSGSRDETGSPTEQPALSFPGNFDSAYDWYVATPLSSLPNVITVIDVTGNILDGALFTTSATNSFIPDESETQAATLADVWEWLTVGGEVPTGGFVDLNFSLHAAAGLTAAGSIARVRDDDNNHNGDWQATDESTMSFGALNPGQSGVVSSGCRARAGQC